MVEVLSTKRAPTIIVISVLFFTRADVFSSDVGGHVHSGAFDLDGAFEGCLLILDGSFAG